MSPNRVASTPSNVHLPQTAQAVKSASVTHASNAHPVRQKLAKGIPLNNASIIPTNTQLAVPIKSAKTVSAKIKQNAAMPKALSAPAILLKRVSTGHINSPHAAQALVTMAHALPASPVQPLTLVKAMPSNLVSITNINIRLVLRTKHVQTENASQTLSLNAHLVPPPLVKATASRCVSTTKLT
jgi:hypothetical protein